MMWFSLASVASHRHPRVAGEAVGTDVEAAPEPNPRYIQSLGLRQQALEVDGRRDLLSWLQLWRLVVCYSESS